MTKTLYRAEKGRQLSVFLDDTPGTLGRVTRLLGEAGVNIYALSLAEGLGHGYVRMVVDKPDDARRALTESEELISEREVILLELANAPGSLGRVSAQLAEAEINLEYAYCAGGPSVEHGLVVMKVDDLRKALAVLGDAG